MAKDNTYKKENAFLVLAKRMSRNKNAMFGLTLFVILVLAIIIVPIVSPYQYDKMDVMAIKQGPSSAHLFGTDDLGRDIFTRVFYGGRYSLSISIAAVLFSTAIGTVVGAIAGYFGGAADTVIMRLLDVIQAIPSMLLTIIISAALGVGIDKTIIAIGLFIFFLNIDHIGIVAVRIFSVVFIKGSPDCTLRTGHRNSPRQDRHQKRRPKGCPVGTDYDAVARHQPRREIYYHRIYKQHSYAHCEYYKRQRKHDQNRLYYPIQEPDHYNQERKGKYVVEFYGIRRKPRQQQSRGV